MSNRVWNKQFNVVDLKQPNIQHPVQNMIMDDIFIRQINSSIALDHRGKWQPIFDRWMKYRVVPTI